MRKILALDCDGVICLLGGTNIDDNRMKLLQDLVIAVPELEIVLSSDWKLYDFAKAAIAKKFEEFGIPQIIGETPNFEFEENNFRYKEIQDWIDKNLTPEDRFAIIDDRDDACIPGFEEFFIQTDEYVGITPEDVRRMIGIFNNNRNV